MKKLIGLTFVIGLAFTSCKKVDASKGTKTDHTVSLTNFSGIDLGMSANMTFTEGATTSIVVNATEKAFNALDIEVKDDILEFDLKNGYFLKNSNDINIVITAPNINHVSLSGSGDIDADFDELVTKSKVTLRISGSGHLNAKDVTAEDHELDISGSGSLISKNLLITHLDADISGSGSIETEGATDRSRIEISGSGVYKGFDLITKKATIDISGSGNAEVSVNEELDITISGSGNVLYKGQPTLQINTTGSGTVIDSN